MNKVAIIGNAGGGKSILARRLGKSIGLPVYAIDDISMQPGWLPTPTDMVSAIHAQWLAEPKWIIDGWGPWELFVGLGSWEIVKQRFHEADTIIIVDFPIRVHYRWALQRQVLAILGLTKNWPPQGCRALPITLRLLKHMRRFNREMRPRLLSLAAEERFRERVVLLRSPRELRAFLRQVTEPQCA